MEDGLSRRLCLIAASRMGRALRARGIRPHHLLSQNVVTARHSLRSIGFIKGLLMMPLVLLMQTFACIALNFANIIESLDYLYAVTRL